MCRRHGLEKSEAMHFQSHQPSQLLELAAPFGIAEMELDDSRHRDRERLASARRAFLLDETMS